MNSWIILLFLVNQAHQQHVQFTLNLNKYYMKTKNDRSGGKCCERNLLSLCKSSCHIVFDVCVTSYRFVVTKKCISSRKTEVVGSKKKYSSFDASSLDNPITFLFTDKPEKFGIGIRIVANSKANRRRIAVFDKDIKFDKEILQTKEKVLDDKQGKLTVNFKLQCLNDFALPNCFDYCTDPKDTNFKCISNKKVCKKGWKDLNCTSAVCSNGCSTENGYCNAPGECMCKAGWKGSFCDQCIPQKGCVNGFCNQPNECKCNSGWKGSLCDQCVPKRGCVNGYCNQPNECKCNTGWKGSLCNQCVPKKGCVNGYCKQPNECKCKSGWKGSLCNQCVPKKNCVNGYCNQPNECKCNTGWKGLHCDQCIPKTGCVNGYCNQPNECICNTGWKGSLCNQCIPKTGCEAIQNICGKKQQQQGSNNTLANPW